MAGAQQRQDHPELRANFPWFRAGTSSSCWGRRWDELLARDKTGQAQAADDGTLDGDYQAWKANDGAYAAQNFFGR